MVELKIDEKDINKLIDKHNINKYTMNNWNIEVDPKEVLYQLNLTEIGKCKRLHLMISCLIYNTIIKVAKNEAKIKRLRSKKPQSVQVKLMKVG